MKTKILAGLMALIISSPTFATDIQFNATLRVLTPAFTKEVNTESFDSIERVQSANATTSNMEKITMLEIYGEPGAILTISIAETDNNEQSSAIQSIELENGKTILNAQGNLKGIKVKTKVSTPKKQSPEEATNVAKLLVVYN